MYVTGSSSYSAIGKGWSTPHNSCSTFLSAAHRRKSTSNPIRQTIPTTLSMTTASRGLGPVETFTSHCISRNVDEYLDWLNNNAVSSLHQCTIGAFTNATLSLPVRQVLPEVMRGIISAIKHQKRLGG